MARFHNTSVHRALTAVKRVLWQPASSRAIRVLSWLRLWTLALGARRAAYTAVEGEISCLKFLEERLDRCLTLVDDLAQYPLPAFSFTSRCELVATWRPNQMHAASFLLFGESTLPGGSDSYAAEVRAALAAAHMEHERLAERHAAVEDRRQRNLLQRRRQEEAVAAAIANHSQAVLQEAGACNATAGTTALLRKQVCAWLLLGFILVTESSFLGLPLLDLVGVNTTSVDAVLARPLLPAAMLLMALMLTHAAIDAISYSTRAVTVFRTARTFSGTKKGNLLYPSILVTLVIIVLHWIWTIRADYASALGDTAGPHTFGYAAATALLLLGGARCKSRLDALGSQRSRLTQVRAAAQTLTRLAARFEHEAKEEEARLRDEMERIEEDIHAIRQALERFHRDVRRQVQEDIEYARVTVHAIKAAIHRAFVAYVRTARRYRREYLVPGESSQAFACLPMGRVE